MTLNSSFNILCKIGIDGGGRVLRKQCNTLRDGAPYGCRGRDYGYRLRIVFDYDLCASAHAGQQRSEIARRFQFRDMNHMLGHASDYSPKRVWACAGLGTLIADLA